MISHFILVYSLLEQSEKRTLVLIAILIALNSLLEVVGVAFVLPFIALVNDVEAIHRYAFLEWAYGFSGMSEPRSFLVLCGFGFALLILIKNTLYMLSVDIQNRFTLGNAARRSATMLNRIIHLPILDLKRSNSIEHQDTLNHFVDSFYTAVIFGYLNIITEGMIIFGIVIVLFTVQPIVTLFVLLLLGGAIGIVYLWLHRWFGRFGVINNMMFIKRHSIARQIFDTIKEIRILGCEAQRIQDFESIRRVNADWQRRAAGLQQLPRVVIESLVVVGIVSLVVAALLVGGDQHAITAMLGLFAVAAFRVMPSATRLVAALSNIRLGEDATRRVARVMEVPQVPAPHTPVERLPFRDAIKIQDIGFSYGDNRRFTLEGVSLTIRHGETIGLIGPTGSGKSTLMDILLGMLPPDRGAVLVDDIPIEGHLPAWRANIGYVPQTITLIDDTIRRNVAFGMPDAMIDDDRIWDALTLAQVDDVVRTMGEGLDTPVGENGMALSGGQRQRIGLARALYRDPPFLCMDEATSALDAETEHRITEALALLHGQKTMLIIAHRLSTLKNCDRLIMMEGGRIKAQGSFAKLNETQPDFRRALELSSILPVDDRSE